jgi:hypothetical protein
MDGFTIRPPVDMDAVNIIEKLNCSGPTPTTSFLAAQKVDLLRSSVHSSGWTSSGELPCPGDYFDASND